MNGKSSENGRTRDAGLGALLGDEIVSIRVRVRPSDVVFVKGVLEASEGLGAVLAEPRIHGAPRDGGTIVIAAPRSQESALRRVIADLRIELAGCMWDEPGEHHAE